jgi:hypothetical protein
VKNNKSPLPPVSPMPTDVCPNPISEEP